MSRFEDGDQPCNDYTPQSGSMPGVANRHSCYGGGAGACAFSVSFCEKCAKDHHEGGWDNCPAALRARAEAAERERDAARAELAEARGLLDYVPDLVSHGGDCTPCCSQGDPQEVNPCAFANSVRAFLARTAPKEASDE